MNRALLFGGVVGAGAIAGSSFFRRGSFAGRPLTTDSAENEPESIRNSVTGGSSGMAGAVLGAGAAALGFGLLGTKSGRRLLKPFAKSPTFAKVAGAGLAGAGLGYYNVDEENRRDFGLFGMAAGAVAGVSIGSIGYKGGNRILKAMAFPLKARGSEMVRMGKEYSLLSAGAEGLKDKARAAYHAFGNFRGATTIGAVAGAGISLAQGENPITGALHGAMIGYGGLKAAELAAGYSKLPWLGSTTLSAVASGTALAAGSYMMPGVPMQEEVAYPTSLPGEYTTRPVAPAFPNPNQGSYRRRQELMNVDGGLVLALR